MKIPSTLQKLWAIAGNDPNNPASGWTSTFDPIGLIFLVPPRYYDYWCTPTNSITFARTGGDGVHFGLVSIDGEITDFSPVVMTVPMASSPNMIVGANLHEFIALGSRFGYFSLEQLIYDPSATINELEFGRTNPEFGRKERALINKLTTAFDVSPWPNPQRRLAELHAMHHHTLQMPPNSLLDSDTSGAGQR